MCRTIDSGWAVLTAGHVDSAAKGEGYGRGPRGRCEDRQCGAVLPRAWCEHAHVLPASRADRGRGSVAGAVTSSAYVAGPGRARARCVDLQTAGGSGRGQRGGLHPWRSATRPRADESVVAGAGPVDDQPGTAAPQPVGGEPEETTA